MRLRIQSALLTSVIFCGVILGQTANHVVISEVYGGGGNSGATWKNDFIELYNPTSSPVDVAGWSVQYTSATGTAWQVTNITGTIPAHAFFLVQEAQGAGGTQSLPTPDVTGVIAMASGAGKVALVKSTTALVGAFPSDTSIVDRVGYGSTANGFEGSGPAPTLTNTTSAERKAKITSDSTSMKAGGADELQGNGYDSDNNSADFIVRVPQPQNSQSPVEPSLSVGGNGTGTARIFPTFVNAASTSTFTISIVGDGTHTLDSILIIVPGVMSWPRNAGNVSLSGNGFAAAVASVNLDTISIGQGAITGTDTGKITISDVVAPDTSLVAIFGAKTALGGGIPTQVASVVSVKIFKLIPIIDLHINDAQGVPAAPYGVGTPVAVTGVITTDLTPTRTDLYVQDGTAGINVFKSSRSFNYLVGDSVTVTGSILQFRGLTEIAFDSTTYIVHASGKPLPDPLVLTADDVNAAFGTDDYKEPNEGRLIRINNVTYNSTNSTITDATGTTSVFIPSPIVASGTFDIVGILKQFKPGTPAPGPPYLADYEIEPRMQSDIIAKPGPVITMIPYETDIQSNSVTITWKTDRAGTSIVKYGLTSSYTDSVVVSSTDTVHSVHLAGLKPATVYDYQVQTGDSTGLNYSGNAIFITSSPAASTGTMNVYFNKSVNTSVSTGDTARTVNIVDKFIARIHAAQYSIDVALYSLSGTPGVGSSVKDALVEAWNRGVKVRMIVEDDNSNTSPMSALKNSGIPFITDRFDAVNAGNGLMHNKFAVFDFRDTTSAADDWVWTGSWNATDPGNNNDAQNVVEIQDKALATAYTMEFNEMWGSATDSPSAANSRFGARKTDNTPHRFNINGTSVELYFSPSDHTTSQIYAALSKSTSSINVAMLTLTRDDLGQLLISKKAAGQKVRVLMDNNTDSGNEYANLQAGSVDVHLKGSALTGLLHHKYAVVDANNPLVDNVVITGSHNWSSSAETVNNENTLVVHSKHIANLYFQEFKARYLEAGGTDNIVLGVENKGSEVPQSFGLSQNYPNPFNPSTSFEFMVPEVAFVAIKVYDVLGREVATLLSGRESPGVYRVRWDASGQPSGLYFCRLTAGNYSGTRKMVLVK